MRQYIISPISNNYLTKDKRYEVLYIYDYGCVGIIDDEGEERTVYPPQSAHTKGFPWKVVIEEEEQQ